MKTLYKAFGTLLRLAIAFAIIAYILNRMDFTHFWDVLRNTATYWPWLLAGLMLIFTCMWLGILRWQIILEAQALHLSLWRIVSIFFVGNFFNAFLMGSTGGDVVKALYAAKETHHKKTEAIATVIADRIVGLIALFVLSLTMIALRYRFFLDHPKTHPFCILMLVLILATAAILALAFSRNIFERFAMFRRLEQRFSFGPALRKAYDAFYLYRARPEILARVFIISLPIHILSITACYCFGRSLQIQNSLVDYITLFPIISSVASLPITPGGLGVREGVAVTLFGALIPAVPASQALPMSLISYLGTLVWSLVGGLVFLFYSTGTGHAIRSELRELEAGMHEMEDEDRAIDAAALAQSPASAPAQLDLFSKPALSPDPAQTQADRDLSPP